MFVAQFQSKKPVTGLAGPFWRCKRQAQYFLQAWIVVLWAAGLALAAQPATILPDEIRQQHDPGKRMDLALELANESVDKARSHFAEGNASSGELDLAYIQALVDECFDSAQEAHKLRCWKKAELKEAALTRRIRALEDDLGMDERERTEPVAAHLDLVHDKLVAGVMSK